MNIPVLLGMEDFALITTICHHNHIISSQHVTKGIFSWGRIHKRDQAQIEPKINSSLQLFILKLSCFLAQLDLDPFCEYGPSSVYVYIVVIDWLKPVAFLGTEKWLCYKENFYMVV